MESLYLLFLAVPIVIVVFPMFFSAKICFDVVENRGSVMLKVFCFRIVVGKLIREGKNMVIVTKKKNEYVNLKVGEKQLRFLFFLQKEVANKILISNVNVYGVVGAGDPFKSALCSTTFANGVIFALQNLKFKKRFAKISFKNKTNFNDVKFCVGTTAKFSFSVFDGLYSFFVAILRNKGERKILT